MNPTPPSKRRITWILLASAGILLVAALIFGDNRVRGLVRNTSLLVAAVTFISLPIGTAVAFLLARFQLFGRSIVTLGWGADLLPRLMT